MSLVGGKRSGIEVLQADNAVGKVEDKRIRGELTDHHGSFGPPKSKRGLVSDVAGQWRDLQSDFTIRSQANAWRCSDLDSVFAAAETPSLVHSIPDV